MSYLDKAQELNQQASDLRNNGRGKEAAGKYQEAAEILEKLGEREKAAESWHMAGVSWKVENNIPEALKFYGKAAGIYRELGSHFGVGRVMTDEGISYAYASDFQKAAEVLHRAVKELEQQDDLAALGIAQAKLGHNYWRLGNIPEAERWFEEGLDNIRRQGSWFFEMTTLFNWAEVDFDQGKFAQALPKLWAAIGITLDEGQAEVQERRLAQIYGLIGHSYLRLGNPAQGLKYFQKAVDYLAPMSRDSAKVVYEDIRTEEFVKSLESADPSLKVRLPDNFK